MTAHTLTVAALLVAFVASLALLTAVVTLTEPGYWERYRARVAYHRGKSRHTEHGLARLAEATTPFPALTAAEAAA